MLWRKLHLNWRYAAGEFSIVLLGVLAALAVDNWNTERKNRSTEESYVGALLDDLRKDDDSIVSAMDGAETFANRGHILLSAIQAETINSSADEFVVAATTAAYLRFPTFTRATINDLMSTGNLRLIRSVSIRAAISEYYTAIENRGQWNQNWREYQVHLGNMVSDFVPLSFREAYEYQSAGGPPWAPKELLVTDADAQSILKKLLGLPRAKPAIENMVRTQGVHYTYHSIVRSTLQELILELEAYQRELGK